MTELENVEKEERETIADATKIGWQDKTCPFNKWDKCRVSCGCYVNARKFTKDPITEMLAIATYEGCGLISRYPWKLKIKNLEKIEGR